MSWYDSSLIVRDFSKALADSGFVDSANEVLDKPYKYNKQYEIWVRFDYPDTEDAEWEDFVEELSNDELMNDDEEEEEEEEEGEE